MSDFSVGVLTLVASDANEIPPCFEDHHNPTLFGETFFTDVVSCGLPELGPYASGTAELFDEKDWRLHVRAAASGGTPGVVATGYVNAQWRDVFTVIGDGSEPSARVPVFIRLRHKRVIENPPFSFLRFELEVRRVGGPSVFYQRRDYGSSGDPATGEREFEEDIPIGEFAPGTRLRIDSALDGVAESGGCCGSLVDPKEAEADVSVSLCSAVAGAFLQGASGGTGDCGKKEGDLELVSVVPVQAVFGADLVGGKDTVIAVDVESTFSSEVTADVELTIRQPELGPPEVLTETITIPAGCPGPKRYYFPAPFMNPIDTCGPSQSGSGLRAPGLEPRAGGTFSVDAAVTSTSETDSDPSNDRAGSSAFVVRETLLDLAYVRVLCASDNPCADDPVSYGHLSVADYREAVRWSNTHLLAMFPIAPETFSGNSCEDDAGPCTVPGSSEKCAPCPPADPDCFRDCPGLELDAQDAWDRANTAFPDTDRAALLVPEGYFRYHRDDEDLLGLTRWTKLFLARGEVSAGRSADVPATRFPAVPHELAHTYAPALGELPADAPRPEGYWVGCASELGLSYPACDVPPTARNLMTPALPGIEPPGVWINLDFYQAVLDQIKTDPDPSVLVITGTITRDGEVTIRNLSELPAGRPLVTQEPTGFGLRIVGDTGEVLFEEALDVRFEFDIHGKKEKTRFTSILEKVPYPLASARIQFLKGDVVVHEIDPLAGTLRRAVLRLPDRAFDRNPGQRRTALLKKVDAFEKALAEKALQGALQQVEHDLRDKFEKWIVLYDPDEDLREPSRDDLLQIADRLALRLRTRIGGADKRKAE